jgi:hypothetical protein
MSTYKTMLIEQYLTNLQSEKVEKTELSEKQLQELIIPISTDPSSPFFYLMIGMFLYLVISAIIAAKKESQYAMSIKCDKLHGTEKELCIHNERERMYQKQIRIASEGESKCFRTRDPEKCRQKIGEIKSKLKDRYEKTMKKIKAIKSR